MQIETSRKDPDCGITCAAIRLLLTALGCAGWLAVWAVVYRSGLGL